MPARRDPIGDAIASLRRDLGEQAEAEAQAGQWEQCAATLRVILSLCPDPMQARTGEQMQIDAQRRVVLKRTLRNVASAGLIS